MENKEVKSVESSEKQPKTRWTINRDLCTGCGECVVACTRGLLKIVKKKVVMLDEDACPQCGDCSGVCITRAIMLT